MRKYWKPAFPENIIGEVTRQDIRAFATSLSETGISEQPINHVLNAGTTALRYAHDPGIIPDNSAAGVTKYTVTPEKRGVLSPEEASTLFQVEWSDERARIASLTAAATGLRAGEIAALQVRDIGDGRLHVRHSWNKTSGLKKPKNGEERTVPIPEELRRELLALSMKNPHGAAPDSFVFWSILPDKPVATRYFLLGMDDDELQGETKVAETRQRWKSRRITFHSWRQYYAARMVDRLDAHKVMTATGHKSGAVFQTYADHVSDEVFAEIAAAGAEEFRRIIPFPGK